MAKDEAKTMNLKKAEVCCCSRTKQADNQGASGFQLVTKLNRERVCQVGNPNLGRGEGNEGRWIFQRRAGGRIKRQYLLLSSGGLRSGAYGECL